MSQDLLLDLNDVGISEYKSVYSIEDQSKIDFINLLEPKVPMVPVVEALLEERIMNKVNKLFVKKDEEIGALIDIISSQKDQIGRLNTELNLVKEKLSAHQLMTDGIFDTLTEKIDKNYLSIRENDKIVKGLYNVYQNFEYAPNLYTNIFTNKLYVESRGMVLYIETLNIILQNIKYIRLNCFIKDIINNNCDIKKMYIQLEFKYACMSTYDSRVKIGKIISLINTNDAYMKMNILIFMSLFYIDTLVDYNNQVIDTTKYKVYVDKELNFKPHFRELKNALIECGYITI